MRVQTNLVQVGVVVRDQNGDPMDGLRQSDFQVFDGGRPQVISIFSVEHAPVRVAAISAVPAARNSTPARAPDSAATVRQQPRYIVLFLDDINLWPSDAPFVRRAAEAFIRDGLAEGDNISILTTSNFVRLDFTTDKDKLLEALAGVQTHLVELRWASACRLIGAYHAYVLTQEHSVRTDAFDLAVAMCPCKPLPTCITSAAESLLAQAEMVAHRTLEALESAIHELEGMPGRRVLLLSSSGFLTQTLGAVQDKIIASALRSRVVINSLDAKGLYTEVPGGSDSEGVRFVSPNGRLMTYADGLRSTQTLVMNDPLAILAEGTGGQFFHNSNDLAGGFRKLASEPAVSYVLGFSPVEAKPNGRFHELKVKLVTKQGYTIEARKGYFAPTKEEQAAQEAPYQRSDRLNREVLLNDTVTEIPTEAVTQVGANESGAAVLRVSVRIDVSKLAFEKRNGRNVERLVLVTALLDPGGRFLFGSEEWIDFSLKAETLATLTEKGFDVKASLKAPRGTYRLREVLEEMSGGKLAALSLPVQIQ